MLPYVLICYQQYTMLPGIRPLQFNIKITFLSWSQEFEIWPKDNLFSP